MPGRFDDLKRLQKMLNDELITREEFSKLKDELLSEAPESAETIEEGPHAPDPAADQDMPASQDDLSVPIRSTRPLAWVKKEMGDLPVGEDAHQIAIDSGSAINPGIIGWYPDQYRTDNMARFYDGDAFVGYPSKRRQPGWYTDHSLESGRVRYFDGLNWTQKTRAQSSAHVNRSELSGDHLYKVAFGLGIASLFLGIVFGLLAWATVAVSGWVLYSTKVVKGRWMAWTGLVLGLVYSLANAYRNGHLDGLF